MNLNHVFILGRVTADPMLRTTPAGVSVVAMGIATNRSWTDKTGNKQEEVEFHNVVIWGKQAENSSVYLKKGQLVLVEGRLATRNWQDKDGHERKTTEIIAEHVEFGPGLSDAQSRPAFAARPQVQKPELAEEEVIPVIHLDADEEATGRSFKPLFSEEEIKPEDIPF